MSCYNRNDNVLEWVPDIPRTPSDQSDWRIWRCLWYQTYRMVSKHYFLFLLNRYATIFLHSLDQPCNASFIFFFSSIAFLAILVNEWHLKRKRTTFISVHDRTWFGCHADGCKCPCANWTEPDAQHKAKAEAYHVCFSNCLLIHICEPYKKAQTSSTWYDLKKGTRATSIGAQAVLKLARILKCATKKKRQTLGFHAT